MARFIGAAVAVAVIGLGVAPAPGASADDSAAFVDYLASNGVNVSTPERSYAAIDYGNSICDLLEANQSVSQTLDFLVNRQQQPQPFAEARIWLIGSVSYLCTDQLHTRN
jgi:uncharacterized Ntn-hydrolase superfamily protein